MTACVSLMKFFVRKYGRRCTEASSAPSNEHRSSLLGNASSLLSISCKSTSAVVAEILHTSPAATDSESGTESPSENVSRRSSVDDSGNVSQNANQNSNADETGELKPDENSSAKYYAARSSAAKNKRLSVKTLELAIDCCKKYISDLEHSDLDIHDQVTPLLTDNIYTQLQIAS